jgi:hypothetical protein
MAAKKARKRAYIPPANEIVNRREPSARPTTRPSRPAASATRGGQRTRQQQEYPVPSVRRTLRRLPIYFVLIFALQYFFTGQGKDIDTQQRLVVAAGSAAFVTVIFAPFMHVMDKFAYNRYLKRTGAQPPAAKQ